jgi:hypothetical protein
MNLDELHRREYGRILQALALVTNAAERRFLERRLTEATHLTPC